MKSFLNSLLIFSPIEICGLKFNINEWNDIL